MNSKFIVIDGKTYAGMDEMPADVRQKYEEAMRNLDQDHSGIPNRLETGNLLADKDHDGMPDALEGLAALAGKANVMNSTKILVNGQAYDSLDQLPPEVRAKYEQAMGKLDANRNGIPDFMEGMIRTQPQPMTKDTPANLAPSTPLPAARHPFDFAPASHNPIAASSTIEPVATRGWITALAGIALIGVCLLLTAAGVWYFFLR